MKKIVIALFFLSGCATAVLAQVTIAGQNFSMLVIIPLILIVIFMVIFGIIIAYDRYREKKEMGLMEEEKKKEDHKFSLVTGLKEKIKEIKEKKMEKKEEVFLEEEYRTLADYLDDIRDLKKRFKKLDANDAFKQLVALIRNFFSDYLGIDYEFTFDELENELKAKNKEVVFFSKNLSDMSYNVEDISKKSVTKLLDEFDDVVKKIILKEEIDIEREGKKKELAPEAKKIKIEEVEKREEAKKTEYLDEEKKNRIIKLIREGRAYIKRDINKANNIYEEVYVLYHQLPKNKKKELQKKVVDFYNAIRLELKS